MNEETVSFSLLELFRLGGIFMWPLLFFSVAVITIVLERSVYFMYHSLRLEDLAEKTADCLRKGEAPLAVSYLGSLVKRRIGARILLALARRVPPEVKILSEYRIERAVETEASDCVNSMERGLNFLTALGSLSPLTGFLGTVSGMIGAFRSIAEATEVNAQIVANGIYEALITTVFGLIIAIIAMAAHSVFVHIVDNFTSRAEKISSDLIALVMDTSAGGHEGKSADGPAGEDRP
ncbi:MAG: MotA/TolQ/ExbB proton channel family protein [Treponema sp.]|jgi:biopolymer transport protein ExbB|nr:MotA/TolQ/ExbB proton channel family protein [Treponema sp.]